MKTPTEFIREEIRRAGVIPFARFMELALYAPGTGYYEAQRDCVGRAGDFITSVSVGSLFGELLAAGFANWLEAMSPGGGRRIAEAGAHDGRLAADILGWLQRNRPALFSEIEYVIVEPSPLRQEWQRERLKVFGPRVRWISGFNDSALPPFHGVLFSNELLDAFPVHRLGWDAAEKKWFEWGVMADGEAFRWARIPEPPGEALVHCPPGLAAVLPHGYTVEVCPAAEQWWREAAVFLKGGRLLAIDYGFSDGERFSPARLSGTLRAYRDHQVSDDLLVHAGEQDLTAHVDFAALQKAGGEAGLKTDYFGGQPQFLTGIFSQALKAGSLTGLDPKQIRQFHALTHPEHLGRAFRVLVQSRNHPSA